MGACTACDLTISGLWQNAGPRGAALNMIVRYHRTLTHSVDGPEK